MSSCSRLAEPLDRCPSLDDVHGALLAALPRGRAWPRVPGSVLWLFWRAIAVVYAWVNDRICAWQAEFWCGSAAESLDDWMREYALPDACDPFPDLCSKVVGATGGRCDDFAVIAARAGWAIECRPDWSVGLGCFELGCAAMGPGQAVATVTIRVHLAASSAWGGTTQEPFVLGSTWGFGNGFGCGPDIGPLVCLLSRVIPAHVAVNYEVI